VIGDGAQNFRVPRLVGFFLIAYKPRNGVAFADLKSVMRRKLQDRDTGARNLRKQKH